MNKKLLERMNELKKLFKNYRVELVSEYNALSNDKVSEKNAIVRKVKKLDADYIRLRDAIKDNNEEVLTEFDREYGILFTNKEESKVEESKSVKPVNVERVSEPAEETSKKEKSGLGKFFMGLGTGLALVGTAAGITSCVKSQKTDNLATYEENPNKEENNTKVEEEKPFDVYGEFNDSSNEKQCQNRAVWFYDKYISQNKGVNAIDLNGVMNAIRMTNGEFSLDNNANPKYNATDIIDVANDLHTIINYATFIQNGNDINFIPMAPLFEDGSLAQQGAMMLDSSMEKVVKAVRENNHEDFLKYSKEWGTTMINIFEYNDFTGEYPSVFQMESYSAFQLYQTMYAYYGNVIMPYSERYGLNICIPYCLDYNTKEIREVPLSEIVYTLTEVPTDWVAKRSGHDAEYAENHVSLPAELYISTKNYFDSKYDLELGRSRRLK